MTLHIEVRCQECGAVVDSRTFQLPIELAELGAAVERYESQGYTVSASDTQTTVGHHRQNCNSKGIQK